MDKKEMESLVKSVNFIQTSIPVDFLKRGRKEPNERFSLDHGLEYVGHPRVEMEIKYDINGVTSSFKKDVTAMTLMKETISNDYIYELIGAHIKEQKK